MQWINGVVTQPEFSEEDVSDEVIKARFLAIIVLLRFMEKINLHVNCKDNCAANLLRLLKLHPTYDIKRCLELEYLQEHRSELYMIR